MTGRGDGLAGAAGGPARHVPVLLEEVVAALASAEGGTILDGTFGAGGYTRALLDAHPATRVVALDRDPNAIAAGAALVASYAPRLALVETRFGELERVAREVAPEGLDGVVLDIGVSSMQLDEAERGFSFRAEGPLDMRMSGTGPSAADIVNEADETTLADIFYHYGEERRSRAIARGICEARRRTPFETTTQLAELVARFVRAEPHGPHPATRTFQGLRIAVNDELGELVRALHGAERMLKPGGRLVVVTFHSLEDRIVKQFLAARAGRVAAGSRHVPVGEPPKPSLRLATKGPVIPSEAELAANPRARSAKLRAAERLDAPAQAPLAAIETLAALPVHTRQRARR
ncbi:16S rRNA (cytosine(1402)-N(4))-methyltransferase RsmH [Salinarimonas ramus]|uniref:Ribosomal RNA small subunit methyltransferase H n=1 Tax=Salinarimonas ramus TaxID=690164 RepID=A0A917Q8B5_9HYPH|nr:16S rRNA (cytosine(1402)-N(4))-methyltransferase RsmH [Salinarimonas ramus]GGK35771.1 ribosomal RNA small subunit methyltransferase H [Salinarimonas ramus]